MARGSSRTDPTLRDYWRVLLRRKWLILVALVFTTAPAVALSLAQKSVYTAAAQMLLQASPGEAVFNSNTSFVDPDRVVQNEIAVLQGEVVYEEVVKELGGKPGVPGVVGIASAKTDLVVVEVTSNDPQTAAIVANAYVEAYRTVKRRQAVEGLGAAGTELQGKVRDLQAQLDAIDTKIATATGADKDALTAQRNQLADQQTLFQQRLDEIQVQSSLSTGSAQLVASAFSPSVPVEPTPKRTAALAGVLGLLLGLGAAFLVDYLDDRIRDADDIPAVGGGDLALLGTIPVASTSDERPITSSKPNAPAAEAYRTLRTNVQFVGLEKPVQVIEVTSAVPGEGKTTTAANLAVVLAQTGATVVILDADLRRPRIERVFGVNRPEGLTDILLGAPAEVTWTEVGTNLTVIGSGRIPPNPSEMLSGRQMTELINELRGRFEYVVIDTAPTLPVSDAVALSRLVDGVVLVVQAGRTSTASVDQALEKLDHVSAPMLGVVLNRAKGRRRGGYGYGAYGGYGGYGGYQATPPKKAPKAAKQSRKDEKKARRGLVPEPKGL